MAVKTAVLLEPNRIEIQDRPVPQPGPDDVLIRVRAIGICGSDTHYFAGRRDHDPQTVYPFVPGHEFSGEVAAVGERVKDTEVGTRALCAPARSCGQCEWCRKGELNVCPNVRFAGSGGVIGCLSEYYLVHRSQLHPIPDSLGFAEATLAEPLAIGLHIVDNLIAPKGGESYAVAGVGPIGLCTVFAASRRGAGKICVADLLPNRLEAARKLGANLTCLVPQDDFVRFVHEHTGGRGVDVAVEAVGEMETILQLTRLASIHGLAIIEGIPSSGEATIAIDAARRRELTVIFGRRSLHKTDEAIKLIEDGTFDASVMLTHEFTLDETQKAFEYTRDYKDGVIKAIVTP